MKLNLSNKHLQIDKANAVIVIAVGVAAFILTFSLIASKALLGQRSYNSRIIAKKQKALTQLKSNVEAAESLVASYQQFVAQPVNVIGGSPTGTGERDGDNGRIILDALPSKYDFPAVTTSLEKILSDRNYKIEGIAGIDDELGQQSSTASSKPVALEIPFQLTVGGNYASLQELIKVLEQSIRPFPIQRLSFIGTNNDMHVTIDSKTYYQPEISLDIRTEVVR